MKDRKITIGYLAVNKIDSKLSWSGTLYAMYDVLKEDYDVRLIDLPDDAMKKLIVSVASFFSGGRIRRPGILRWYYAVRAFFSMHSKENRDVDVYFAPACRELIAAAAFPEGKKLIYFSDSTYALLQGYYFHNSEHDCRIGHFWEQEAVKKADRIIYSNNWAARDAVSTYGAEREKVSVIPFFPGIPDRYDSSIPENRRKRRAESGTVRILLSGVEWERKGMDIAVDALNILNAEGDIRYELTIAGVSGHDGIKAEGLTFAGRLNKSIEREEEQYIELFKEADIFLLPTRAECSAIVFCEAAMYGLPVVSCNTGGTADYVVDGYNGILLEPESDAKKYADAVRRLAESDDISGMGISARSYYEEKLNRENWRREFARVMKSLEE